MSHRFALEATSEAPVEKNLLSEGRVAKCLPDLVNAGAALRNVTPSARSEEDFMF